MPFGQYKLRNVTLPIYQSLVLSHFECRPFGLMTAYTVLLATCSPSSFLPFLFVFTALLKYKKTSCSYKHLFSCLNVCRKYRRKFSTKMFVFWLVVLSSFLLASAEGKSLFTLSVFSKTKLNFCLFKILYRAFPNLLA